MRVDPLNIGAILIAVITGLSVWASHRSTAKASVLTDKQTAEVEAYNRARKMDLETIQRQDEEFDELRGKYTAVKARLGEVEDDCEKLRNDNVKLTRRVYELERKSEGSNEQQGV